jgi:hypothetical protein
MEKNMDNQSSITLLTKLKNSVDKIEKELLECKKLIGILEDSVSQGTVNKDDKVKGIISNLSIEPKTFVAKIEEEYKSNKFDSLTWLVSQKNINRDIVIGILNSGGIILPKSTAKGRISGEVKQILSTRHSFSKS